MKIPGAVRTTVFLSLVLLLACEVDAQADGGSTSPSGAAQAFTIALPIAAGVVGYFIVYWNNWRLERRKAELKFVSDQLQYLYGPLFALNEAGGRAVAALMIRHGHRRFFFEPDILQYSADDIEEYRLWMSEVFMPNNLRVEKIIIENAHLIEGARMPDSFGAMLACVAGYKAVMKTWPENPPKGKISFEEAIKRNSALLPFPDTFPKYVTMIFNRLKKRQTLLLGSIGQDTAFSAKVARFYGAPWREVVSFGSRLRRRWKPLSGGRSS